MPVFNNLAELEAYGLAKGLIVKSVPSAGIEVTTLSALNLDEVVSTVEGKICHDGLYVPECGRIYYLVLPDPNANTSK